jgi:hypothetical protein
MSRTLLSHIKTRGCKVLNGEVDLLDMLEQARRSQLAYEDEEVIRTHLGAANPSETCAGLPAKAVQIFYTSDSVRLILETDHETKEQFLIGRGTANSNNMGTNIKYVKKRSRRLGIDVHAGFLTSAKEAMDLIRPNLLDGYGLTVTGHSLGAAVSSLVAMYLYMEGYPLDVSYTFGQPKLTDRDGAKAFRCLPLIRVVNERDPVPQLPPVSFLSLIRGMYCQMCSEFMFMADANQYAWFPCAYAEKLHLSSIMLNVSNLDLKDHSIDLYIRNIQDALGDGGW